MWKLSKAALVTSKPKTGVEKALISSGFYIPKICHKFPTDMIVDTGNAHRRPGKSLAIKRKGKDLNCPSLSFPVIPLADASASFMKIEIRIRKRLFQQDGNEIALPGLKRLKRVIKLTTGRNADFKLDAHGAHPKNISLMGLWSNILIER